MLKKAHNNEQGKDLDTEAVIKTIIVASSISFSFIFWLGWPSKRVHLLIAGGPWLVVLAVAVVVRILNSSERTKRIALVLIYSCVVAEAVVFWVLVYPSVVVENRVYYDYHVDVVNRLVRFLSFFRREVGPFPSTFPGWYTN